MLRMVGDRGGPDHSECPLGSCPMRGTSIMLAVLATAALAPGAATAHAATPKKSKARTAYYVSLGDSLSTGYQKDAAGNVVYDTRHDYTALAFKQARKHYRKLRLKRFGCAGEDTTTFQQGGCPLARTP